MQIKKSKFLIGTLLSVASIGVVGSITGTYAWYTYNTKDTLVYHGIAAADNENLEFRIYKSGLSTNEGWKTAIATSELAAASEANGFAGQSLEPITFNSKQERNASLQPFVGKYEQYISIAPTDQSETKPYYFQVTLQFRCLTVEETPEAVVRDIFLSRLNIKTTSDGKDITPAIRMHFDNGTAELDDKTLVAPAKTADGQMNLYGTYDMDGDGVIDHGTLVDSTYGIYEKDSTGTKPGAVDVPYGNNSGFVEYWYGTNSAVASFQGREHVANTGRKILKTSNSTTVFNSVTLTIWLDGWDAACVNSNAKCEFDLDLQFQSAKQPA